MVRPSTTVQSWSEFQALLAKELKLKDVQVRYTEVSGGKALEVHSDHSYRAFLNNAGTVTAHEQTQSARVYKLTVN